MARASAARRERLGHVSGLPDACIRESKSSTKGSIVRFCASGRSANSSARTPLDTSSPTRKSLATRLQTWDDRDPCSVLGGHRSDPACLGSLTSTNHAAVPPLPSLCGMVHDAGSGRMQVCGTGSGRMQVCGTGSGRMQVCGAGSDRPQVRRQAAASGASTRRRGRLSRRAGRPQRARPRESRRRTPPARCYAALTEAGSTGAVLPVVSVS